jgi:nucleoside-diphosphate-sugar epimerase
MAEAGVTALKVQPCRHVVYLSSDAVYGWETTLISEHTPPSPPDLYGTMHLARERMLGQCLGPAKIPFTVIRLCAVYGPGDTHDGYGPNRFLRQATSGAAITLFGEGEETRDHLFVDDAVALIRACIDRPESRLLNAVSGRSRSFRAVAEAVHRLVSRGPGPAVTPRTNPITHRAFDATRLLRAFPAHHSTNLEHGLRLTLDRSVPGQFQQP